MIERKTVLEQPEINRAANLGVKICKLLVDDGVEIDWQWHRTCIGLGDDPLIQMSAVNDHLVLMGYPPLSADDLELITECHALMVKRYG